MVRVHLSPPNFLFNCVGRARKYHCTCFAYRLVKEKITKISLLGLKRQQLKLEFEQKVISVEI